MGERHQPRKVVSLARIVSAAIVLAVVLAPPVAVSGQSAIGFENGYNVPARGNIRVLVAFAEVNFLPCGGGWTQGAGAHPNWPEGQPPLDKDEYYDQVIAGAPHAYLTDYYYQMSFGAYRMTGDYFSPVVTLDCTEALTPGRVVEVLNARPAPVVTAHNLTLDEFDQWTPTSPGTPKIHAADNKVDVLMVVWRNLNPFSGSECGNCFTGSMTTNAGGTLGNKTGFNNLGNFGAWGSGRGGWGIFIHEYLHTLFGGNNWHIGDGADYGSFHAPQAPWGMTAHSPAASNVANAWDRDHLKWKPAWKRYTISALNTARREVRSDLTIASHPGGATFVLRDFVRTGDAVRIKLPHINWVEFAPKNQYLWLENHQRRSRFDVNGVDAPCQALWSQGLYAYVQVGKDTGATDVDGDGQVTPYDLYPPSVFNWYPNALGSWLMPLSAQGRRDWLYRFDLATPADPTMPCQWDNASMPIENAMSLANPFTGYSELFFSADTDSMLTDPVRTLLPLGNGLLHSGEPKAVLTEVVNGEIVRRLPSGGSPEQAFSFQNGRTKLGLATNPAPLPVYTRQSSWGYVGPNLAAPEDWENRTIWLNGLRIDLLGENVDGDGAILVRIRWDDWKVDQDVRWTGNIVLDNDANDPWDRQSKIVVTAGHHVYLDRGLSPTRDFANDDIETIYPFGRRSIFPAGLLVEHSRLFTDPTLLTLKSGTKLHLQRNATLWIQNGSALEVEAGAEVQLEPGASIQMGPGGGDTRVFGTIRLAGDLDGNGCVDRRDFALMLRAVFDPSQQSPFLDLNEDGRVDILDALRLAEFFTRRFGALCAG